MNEDEGTVPRAAKRGAAALPRVSRERCRGVCPIAASAGERAFVNKRMHVNKETERGRERESASQSDTSVNSRE